MAQNTVVDASALGAVLFGEPQRAEVVAQLAATTLLAPAILPFELGNLCLSKCRRQPASRDDIVAKFARWRDLAIDLRSVDHADVLLLAEETGLTFYDASYLWLAQESQSRLVTLDVELAQAYAVLR
jgi:predicted nucleic acid-binding protein